MADSDKDTITIDYDKVESILGDWSSALGSFEPQKASQDGTLLALQSAGLESGFMHSYDENFENAKSSISNLISEVTSSFNSIKKTEEEAEEKIPTPRGPGGGSQQEEEEKKHTDEELKTLQLKEYEKMSLEDLSGIVDELTKLAAQENVTIEKLLTDKKYQEKLVNVLSKSSHVSKDLKDLIEESGEVTQKLLLDISNGKYPSLIGYNEKTQNIYYTYLNNIANKNNISLKELLTEDKYNDIYKKAFKQFNSITTTFSKLSDEEIIKKLESLESLNNEKTANLSDEEIILLEFANLPDNERVSAVKDCERFGVFTKMNEGKEDLKKLMENTKASLDESLGKETSISIRTKSEPTDNEPAATQPVQTTTPSNSDDTPVVATPDENVYQPETVNTEGVNFTVDSDGSINIPMQSVTADNEPVSAASGSDSVEMQSIVYDSNGEQITEEIPAVVSEQPSEPTIVNEPVIEETPIVEEVPVVEETPVYDDPSNQTWEPTDESGDIEIPIFTVPSNNREEETVDITYQ